MDFLEKDLEDIIFENAKTEAGKKILFDRGLDIEGKIFRQVDIGSYGRIDLLSVFLYKDYYNFRKESIYDIFFNVYELKKGIIDEKALIQGMRYIQGLKDLLFQAEFPGKVNTQLTLIGNKVSNDDFVFLYSNISKVSIYTYTYKIDGIHFDYCGKNWSKTNPEFNEDLINVVCNPGIGLLKSLIKNEQDYKEEE